MKKGGVKGIILGLIMAGLIVGYYFYLSNRDVEKKTFRSKSDSGAECASA